MSITRAATLLSLLACGREPPPAAPPVPLPPPPPASLPAPAPHGLAPAPLPSMLAASPDAGTMHDVDASAFVRPTGVYVLVHEAAGDTNTRLLGKAASCAKANAYFRVDVATARILHAEGPQSVADCIAAFLKRDASWKQGYDIAEIEIVVTK